MSIKKEVLIKTQSPVDADTIASAMGEMSGCFSAGEWKAISKKLQNKTVQMRIRLLIQ